MSSRSSTRYRETCTPNSPRLHPTGSTSARPPSTSGSTTSSSSTGSSTFARHLRSSSRLQTIDGCTTTPKPHSQAALTRRGPSAQRCNRCVMPLMGTRPAEKPHAHQKYWQELLGQVGGRVRAPMLELTDDEKAVTRAAFEQWRLQVVSLRVVLVGWGGYRPNRRRVALHRQYRARRRRYPIRTRPPGRSHHRNRHYRPTRSQRTPHPTSSPRRPAAKL